MEKALEIYLPKMWARVKLNRQKIMENYLNSSRSSPPNVFFSKSVHVFWRTHLGDCFWSFFGGLLLEKPWNSGKVMENISKCSRSSLPAVFFWKGVYPTAKIIAEFGFLFSVFSCVRILSLYGKIRVRENP